MIKIKSQNTLRIQIWDDLSKVTEWQTFSRPIGALLSLFWKWKWNDLGAIVKLFSINTMHTLHNQCAGYIFHTKYVKQKTRCQEQHRTNDNMLVKMSNLIGWDCFAHAFNKSFKKKKIIGSSSDQIAYQESCQV